jgi:hypothetical protein
MDRSIPYLSLTEVVEDYMISNFNDERKYLVNYLVHAKWIWKKLLWSTVWQITSKYIKVKAAEDGQLYIDVPKDMIRFINLSRSDSKGRLRPFVTDDSINALAPTYSNGVACSSCGESDELGACVTGMTVITEQVTIDGTPYVNKTWKKLEKSGDLLEIRELWVKDYSDPDNITVTKTTLTKTVFSFEVKDCGCLVKCDKNEQLVQQYCGALCANTKMLIASGKDWAKVKVFNGKIFFSHRGKVPDFVILSYQTNGECGESEIMVPEYAVEALTFGIHWRAGALAPARVVSPNEKNDRKDNWLRVQQELDEFLNPIRMEDFMDGQMSLPKWGSANPWDRDEDCSFEVTTKSSCGSSKPECCLTEARVNFLIDQKIAALNIGGGSGLQGPAGPPGPAGPADDRDLDYHHHQEEAAEIWTIDHNLGFEPNIEIKNEDGVTLWGWDFKHMNLNQVVITHGLPVAGDAYLS